MLNDDIVVASMTVAIRRPDGAKMEFGPAVENHDLWTLQAAQTLINCTVW